MSHRVPIHEQHKTLVFIVAFEAERHITDVLNRIPRLCLNAANFDILLLDDCSTDQTSEVAQNWVTENHVRNISILKGSINLGYGGNQKLGYRYAVDRGYQAVVLLHGDGQYDPANILQASHLIIEDSMDVALGSRMHAISSARRGGMPIYKIVGNRLLTIAQNFLTGQNLSEFHTGFRAYSCRFLRSVPFELNSNGFDFDTEILLQAFHARAKLREFPIATRYGDEECRVDGLSYAWQVIRASLEYWAHMHGFACSLKFPRLSGHYYQNKILFKGSTHELAQRHFSSKVAPRVLDIGGAPSIFVETVRQRNGYICGVDVVEAVGKFDQFHQIDLEANELPVDIYDFDVVLMLDVLEHLTKPESFLLSLRNRMRQEPKEGIPKILISTPNIAFVALRIMHLFGRFNYAERGILDITHKRLFTRHSVLKMLEACGYDVKSVVAVGVPFELVFAGSFAKFLGRLSNVLARLWPGGFAFQFFVEAVPRPCVGMLLRQARPMPVSPKSSASNG